MFDPTDPDHMLVPLGERPAHIQERNFDKLPLDHSKWQLVNGWKVVSAQIPRPVAYVPATNSDGKLIGPYAWMGWQGVIGADGQVYHYETGARMWNA